VDKGVEKTRRVWLEVDEGLGAPPGWKMIMDGLIAQASMPQVKRAVIKILTDYGEFEIEVRKTAELPFPESERLADEEVG
jgi:hypothetical protein